MKLKMFLVFILTFILVRCVSFADTYTFTYREDFTDSEWKYLYEKICSSNAQRDISTAEGCKYYWGEDIVTFGFSGNTMAYNGHGCPNDRIQTAANFNPDPATCQSGIFNKFELLGFYSIDEVVTLLKNNNCVGGNCLNYVKSTYCNNLNNNESICTSLSVQEQKNSENVSNADVILEEDDKLTCDDLFGEESEELKDLIRVLYNLVRILIPVIVIVFSSLDFAKAVLSGSEDEMKKVTQRFSKRLLIAVAIFLVPLVMKSILRIGYDIWGILSPDFCGIL